VRAAILGQKGGWHTESLTAALRRRGIEPECVSVTRLAARISALPRLTASGTDLDTMDVVFVRAIPAGSLEQVIYRMDALRQIEAAGVRVVNPARAIERGVDKYYTASLLADAGIPTPPTIVAEQFEDAMAAFEELGGDVVIKPLFGSEGRGMVRVGDPDSAYRALRALELGRYIYCLQRFVPHPNQDIRTFVVGGRVIGAMLRRATSWKTNAAQGASTIPFTPDDGLCDLSVRAAAAVGADYAGVDILPGDDGTVTVLEVNTIPGWRALRAATGIDPAETLVDHILGDDP
jgi:RimK family alpha-L-glutamate ligase